MLLVALIKILPPKAVAAFRAPPVLTKAERNTYFRLTPETRAELAKMRDPTSRAGFMLQLGYFRATKRFYNSENFRQRDIDYVLRKFRLSISELSRYSERHSHRHRRVICELLHCRFVGDKEHRSLRELTDQLVENQESPRFIFNVLEQHCWRREWVIPAYSVLAALITDSYNHTEQRHLDSLYRACGSSDEERLEELLVPIENDAAPGSRAALTLLKKLDQSVKVQALNKSADTLALFRDHFFEFTHIYDALSVTDKAVEYYSGWLMRAHHQQITAFTNRYKTYLHLLCFIKDQFYRRQDHAVDAVLKKTRSAHNAAQQAVIKIASDKEKARIEAIENLKMAYLTDSQFAKAALTVIEGKHVGPEERLRKLEELADDYRRCRESENADAALSVLDQEVDRFHKNTPYYEALEQYAGSLRRSLAKTVSTLVFDGRSRDKDMLEAIDYYKANDTKIGPNPPIAFLSRKELDAVFGSNGINTDLYEAIFLLSVAERIRSNGLNLLHSFRYRAIQDFLIPLQEWTKNREKILKDAGLFRYRDIDLLLSELKAASHERFETVNNNLINGKNPYCYLRDDGFVTVNTPRTDFDESSYIASTLNERGIVPVFDVLKVADRYCGFTDRFTHFSNKHSKMEIEPEYVMAGIMARGCNIGVGKLCRISTGLREGKLRNTVNWCFSASNLQDANQVLTRAIRKLVLSKQFEAVEGQRHSSSDGRKVVVSVDSIASAYSFKYFGQEQGVTDYCFIDDRQAFFHALVFTSTDRDAPYVLDGLADNNETKEQIHSTDTHGFTEQLFGASYLMGITFAPRIAKPHRYALYGFSEKGEHQKKGYWLQAKSTIKQKLIKSNWEDLLRFIATIRLHRTSASRLFKRLSSYAREHPLYKALKEFGRIIKTHFLLTYFDDVELRQRIQRQLNTAEQGQKFSRAIFFANDQAFRHGSLEEQKAAVDCRILIQNCIVLWNYLALSEQIANTSDSDERAEMVEAIKGGSVITWSHVNLHGEYKFAPPSANDPYFDIPKIQALRL